MNGVGRIIAELTFLSRAEGGRKNPPNPNWVPERDLGYMPHVVVEGSNEYLGVRFLSGPKPVLFGEAARFEMLLMYPGVDYSALVPGAMVTVREGKRIVARGRILSRI